MREWLVSPVVYIPDEIGIFEGLAEFFPEILKHHYYGLAYKTNKKYIKGNDFRDVKIVKKTLYVIRCILAWKILEGEIFPPMNFDELIGQSELDAGLKQSIFHLKEGYSKLAIDEVSDEEFTSIHDWIKDSLKTFEKKSFTTPKRNIEDYNTRFQEIIGLNR